ncbi:MAG: NitT/TauT family transport system permease protein [Clostridia bacterium]|nr:NitT/TauT family transport system permease protein [Clostridia bacterium]
MRLVEQNFYKNYGKAVLFVLLLWQVLAWLAANPGLPGPIPAIKEFIGSWWPELARHTLISAYRVLLSLLLSLATAVPLGLWIGRCSRLDSLLGPVAYLLYPVPKVALLPVIMLLLGIGEGSKVALIFLVIFFQILVTTRDAARKIPEQLLLSVRSLGAGSWELYRQVIIPACLPEIFTASRISLGSAISVLFLSETVAGRSGLGYYILDGMLRAEYGVMFAGILAISFLGLILYALLDILEIFLCPWRYI